jgi:hypothetical protein
MPRRARKRLFPYGYSINDASHLRTRQDERNRLKMTRAGQTNVLQKFGKFCSSVHEPFAVRAQKQQHPSPDLISPAVAPTRLCGPIIGDLRSPSHKQKPRIVVAVRAQVENQMLMPRIRPAQRALSRVVLVALDVGLNVLRRHKAHLMAQPCQLASPVMCRRTSFHADQTRRQSRQRTL